MACTRMRATSPTEIPIPMIRMLHDSLRFSNRRKRPALLSFLLTLAGLSAVYNVLGAGLGTVSSTRDAGLRFEVSEASLSEAAGKAARVLDYRIVINLNPGHPARKTRVSLSMPVSEPNDLLNALAAAYGLRWLD